MDGGVRMDAEAPVSTMPLYVRAGSIVPMGPEVEYAMQKPLDTVELRIYPGADGTFTLYEDAGEGYEYETGAFAMTPIKWVDKTRTLSIGAVKGSFPGMMKKRVYNVVVVGEGVGGVAAASTTKVVKWVGVPVSVMVK